MTVGLRRVMLSKPQRGFGGDLDVSRAAVGPIEHKLGAEHLVLPVLGRHRDKLPPDQLERLRLAQNPRPQHALHLVDGKGTAGQSVCDLRGCGSRRRAE